jgi:hypothetical protein
MHELFNDILSIEGVKGVMLFSFSGDLLFREMGSALPPDAGKISWSRFLGSLEGMRETDLVFEKGRIYIRRTDIGFLVILTGLFVSMAILRLNCDILLPSLTPTKSSKRWGRFFKR